MDASTAWSNWTHVSAGGLEFCPICPPEDVKNGITGGFL